MSTEATLLFIMFSGVAAYVHTISGFALNMIIMGAATALELTSVPVAAAVVSLITLVNGLFALPGNFNKIYWRGTAIAMLGILPAMVLGVVLLDYLNDSAYQLLRFLLGITILLAAIHLFLDLSPATRGSSQQGYFLSGLLGGFFGGLFAIPGPPLIYHYYRQPLELSTIRNGLILLFVFTSAARTLYIGAQGQLTEDIFMLTALTVPVVALATLAGRYYPPGAGKLVLKRFVILILSLIGLNLILDGVMHS